jgi:hypothetical protein
MITSLSGNLRSPVAQVGRDLERDARPFTLQAIAGPREKRPPYGGETSDLAPDDALKRFRLVFVGALVNEETGRLLGLPCPEVAFPSPYSDEAETVEVDVSIVAAPDVPEENGLAEAVVRGLGKGAGARNGAAAIVKPVPGDMPAGDIDHGDLHSLLTDYIRQ